ncbi:hypothetical protein LB565_18120 [Mesorhizobium sp. CA14]|uniref:hypothetical protein n=1 Tax=Mesorhizobium sp. CA14 TaxID=2876642 RepID=UPI001CC970A0|nr:hypothetical protein [Mesorhizobium sp. CA14]MBZ9849905.1 hypothetical protein [Mesorhizobium sp. CA14]
MQTERIAGLIGGFPTQIRKRPGAKAARPKYEGHNLQRGTSPGAMGGKHRAMLLIWGLNGVFSTNRIPKKSEIAKKSRSIIRNRQSATDAFSRRSA